MKEQLTVERQLRLGTIKCGKKFQGGCSFECWVDMIIFLSETGKVEDIKLIIGTVIFKLNKKS